MTEPLDDEEGFDVTGAVRLGLDIVLTVLCLYVMWGYVKDQPEVTTAQARLAGWWHETTTKQKRIRKAEKETVFEAMQVVDDGRD